MTRHVVREDLRSFWVAVRAGVGYEEAARRVGHERSAGYAWVRKVGGVMPTFVMHPPAGRYLSLEERVEIRVGIVAGWSIRKIARGMGRHPSTVLREIRRNSPDRYRSRRLRRWSAASVGRAGYCPVRAQRRAERVVCQAAAQRPRKISANPALRDRIQELLEEDYSPEQVAAQLRLDHPDEVEWQVSHETIYKALYVQGRGALRRDLHQRLRTGRALRKPHRRADQRRGRIPDMVHISQRPAEAADRAVPGHWEGDLIMGSTASNSAIGTLVERASRFVMLLHLPNGHGADAVQQAMVAAMSQLPATLRRTLTWDQGSEMTNHVQIASALDLQIFFCDPHSPWQRGSNENTNGLLRQYFPKATDLSIYPSDYLDYVAMKLNRRPRKTLGWKTPAAALDQLLSNPTDPNGVASVA